MSKDAAGGLAAEFERPEELARAVRDLRERGYRTFETFTPFPVRAVERALEPLPASRLPLAVFAGGVTGAVLGYGIQWYLTAIDYPLDVGARPLHSAPAFIPITFESAILLAALTTVIGLFLGAGLPRLWRPIFEIEGFGRASLDRFFIVIDREDDRFDRERSARELEALGALRIVAFGESAP